jgi:hypothetical protein
LAGADGEAEVVLVAVVEEVQEAEGLPLLGEDWL